MSKIMHFINITLRLAFLLAVVLGAGSRARMLDLKPATALGGSAVAGVLARRLPSDAEIAGLESVLGYTFKEKWNVRLALIHPSFGELNNARLTWLGDAVLGAAVSDLLYRSLPSNATTGQLHDARAARVRREACAVAAKRLGLAPLLVVGKGYEGQEPTPAMLAECFEAVWGAVYEDSGYSLHQVRQTYNQLFPV